MVYYRVKPEYDNARRFTYARGGGLSIDGIYVGNELYTARELEKYCGAFQYVERVEVPKSKIYFFFGARFAVNGGPVWTL